MNNIIEKFFGKEQKQISKLTVQERLDILRQCDDELKEHIAKIDYKEFLRSLYWKTIVEYLKDKNNYQCSYCGDSNSLVIHHLSYLHHGEEHKQEIMDSDLVCICKRCHGKIHQDKLQIQHLKIYPNQKVVETHKGEYVVDMIANAKAAKILSAAAYALYMHFVRNKNGHIEALSIKNIISTTSLSERTYYKAIKELIEQGYLIKTPHPKIKEYYLFYEDGPNEI